MPRRPVTAAEARRLILDLPGVAPGRSYGLPAFLMAGKFFARFRDDDAVLVVRLSSIDDRDVLMRLAPEAFFFTDHYRDSLAVLVRLAEVDRRLLAQVLEDARKDVSASVARPARPARGRPRKTRTR
jgi:hypothetical protein